MANLLPVLDDDTRLTRKEAERLIADIRADKISPYRTKHVKERFENREYFAHDLRAIVQRHRHMSTPRWDEERLDGICTYITIMPELEFMKERARRS